MVRPDDRKNGLLSAVSEHADADEFVFCEIPDTYREGLEFRLVQARGKQYAKCTPTGKAVRNTSHGTGARRPSTVPGAPRSHDDPMAEAEQFTSDAPVPPSLP